MFLRSELEGYLEINHRESPGVTFEQAEATGFACLPVGKGERFQAKTYNCCMCTALIIVRPERTRERHWCYACNKYTCDACVGLLKAGAPHKPIMQVIGEALDAMARKDALALI